MDYELLTFGEFLSAKMKEKEISISKLAELTKTKSRNAIQRLLKDKSSIEVIQNFKTKLIKEVPLFLSESDIELLDESIEVSRMGKDKLYASRILLELFKIKEPQAIPYNIQVFGSTTNQSVTLPQLLKSYLNYSSVNMLIFDAKFAGLSEILLPFIQKVDNKESDTVITIEHIIYMDNSASESAEIFLLICKLLNYKNYHEYYNNSLENQHLPDNITYALSNFIVVDKVSGDEVHSIDLIKIDNNMNFSMLYNNTDYSLYDFYLNCFNTLKADCQRIRKTYGKMDLLNKVTDICDYLYHLEKSSAQYLIKQNMCLQMIHTDILYKMLVDSNFFGLPEDDPKIQRLIQITLDRFNNYFNTDKMRISVFTKRGLEDFVKHSNITDHFCLFREFTKEEVKFTLEFILNQLETNPFFKIYLLKDDYIIPNIEYSYYEDHVLYLFGSCSGYDEDSDEGIITVEPIISIFDKFIKNILIKHHTLPECESISFLKHLISTIW